uniref:SAP domain-containing protein n=1 Tax=Ditylum brightwellii TaxID=49249 RepID=A0A7S4WF10_9STRA
MSLVDKSMFSSGLNMTRNAMEKLTEKGYAEEVTQQADGTEFMIGEDGKSIPYSPLGKGISADEARSAMMNGQSSGSGGDELSALRKKIPFIDTPSPWQQSMPVEEARLENDFPTKDVPSNESPGETIKDKKERVISKITEKESDEEQTNPGKEKKDASKKDKAGDPIDLLTVARLKEILREQKLKVSGTKQELRDRLRSHVNSMLTEEVKENNDDGSDD